MGGRKFIVFVNIWIQYSIQGFFEQMLSYHDIQTVFVAIYVLDLLKIEKTNCRYSNEYYNKQAVEASSSTSRYLDDLLNIDNPYVLTNYKSNISHIT